VLVTTRGGQDPGPGRCLLPPCPAPLSGGIALGALGSGLLVSYAPLPTRLAYLLLVGVFAVLLLLVAGMPETVRRDGGGLRSLPPRVVVPPQARGAYAALLPSIVARAAARKWSLLVPPPPNA